MKGKITHIVPIRQHRRNALAEKLAGDIMDAINESAVDDFNILDEPESGRETQAKGQDSSRRESRMAQRQKTEALAKYLQDAVAERIRMDKKITAEHPQYGTQYHLPAEKIKIARQAPGIDIYEVRIYSQSNTGIIGDIKIFMQAAEKFARENNTTWGSYIKVDKGIPCLCFHSM